MANIYHKFYLLKFVSVLPIIIHRACRSARKIASLAWRRPRVQIPTSPYLCAGILSLKVYVFWFSFKIYWTKNPKNVNMIKRIFELEWAKFTLLLT